jgi:hypothetical protein
MATRLKVRHFSQSVVEPQKWQEPQRPAGFSFTTDSRFSGKLYKKDIPGRGIKAGQRRYDKQPICKLKSPNRCPIQLVYCDGQPVLRMCDDGQATDTPVDTPLEAQAIAADACDNCWPRRKLKNCAPENAGGPCKPQRGGSVATAGLRGVGKAKQPKWLQCRTFGKMTAARERRLPDAAFGLVKGKGKNKVRKYPMPDPKHAVSAKGRAKTQLKKKTITKAQYNAIVKKADRVIKACPGALRRKR